MLYVYTDAKLFRTHTKIEQSYYCIRDTSRSQISKKQMKIETIFFSPSYNCHELIVVIIFLGKYFMDLASLWICSGVLWAHLLSTWEPRADKCSPFITWSRSEYSHTFFSLCQEFLPCPNFYLLVCSPFQIIPLLYNYVSFW